MKAIERILEVREDRENEYAGRILFVFFLFFLGLLSVKTVHNPDLFWHLKVGEDILSMQMLPRYDLYSYHQGLKFFAHEWLFDVFLAKAHSFLGMYGVLLLMQLVGVVSAYLIYLNARLRTGNSNTALFLTLLVGGLYISNFLVPRPQMVSAVLALLVFYLLEKWFGNLSGDRLEQTSWHRRYLVFAAICVVWINMHGGSYPIGEVDSVGQGA